MNYQSVQEHDRAATTDFSNLIIDRTNSVRGLLKIFENSQGPLSIRLNAAYGSGKTTFLDHLDKIADKNLFVTIYYNAWEEEISLDAKTSLCIEILNHVKNLNSEESFKQKVFKFQKAILPTITSAGIAVTSRVLFRDHEALQEIWNSAKPEDEIRQIMNSKFEELENRRTTIRSTKDALNSLVKDLSGKKILLLIDELDRCRPDFAIEILETVKHFFSIEGMFAVIGVDENVLNSIIKKRYGESINCEGYLLRHFSSEIRLSDFSYERYCQSKCREFAIGSDFHKHVIFICSFFCLTLRQMNNFIANLASLYNSEHKAKTKDFGRFVLTLGLKTFDRQLFDECVNKERDEYFQKRIRELRLSVEDPTGPFEEFIFLIQKSRSDYKSLCEKFSCRDYPDFNRYYGGSGKTGIEQYAMTIAKFADFSALTE